MVERFKIYSLSIALICCLGAIAYANTLHCSFHFDDHFFIVDNSVIKNISNLSAIWKFLPCRFLFYLSLALNYHISQLHVWTYHVVNITFHLITAVLVWYLVRLTLQTPILKKDPISTHADSIALLAGLVFVSHPIQTQGVTYIMQRSACMSSMFYVATLCLYVKSRLVPTGRAYYIGALITTIMAMFTKEISITLPLMIVLYEFTFLKTKRGFEYKQLIPFLGTLLIIPVIMYFTHKDSINSQEIQNAVQDSANISSTQYLLTQFRVICTYIRLLFLPLHQGVDYDYTVSQSLFELPTLISFLFLSGILAFAVWSFSRYRLMAFGILWFFLSLVPESSIFAIKDVIFEHRLYLPMVGFSIFLVSAAYYVLGRHAFKAMVTVLGLVVLCNAVLTYERNKVWKDDATLWDDAILKCPHKARPYSARGLYFFDKGNLDQAMADFTKAIALDSNYRDAYNNRGLIYYKRNQFTKAIADYNKAIAISPNQVESYDNRGSAYDKMGDLTDAIADYNKVLEINPNYAGAYNNLGLIYYKQDKLDQAIADYNKAIAINPDREEVFSNRGSAYAKQDNYIQAIADYNQAIKVNPAYAEAYNNLGYIYDKQGNTDDAIADFSKAIDLDPSYTTAYYNRGKIYALQNNFAKAMTDFDKVTALDPSFEEVYSNRGLVHAKQGEFDQAIADYSKAIALNPKNADAYANRGSAYAMQGHFAQALADFNKAIAFNPKAADTYNNRGRIFSHQAAYPQSVADFNKAIELDPHNADAYNNRAISYFQLKQYSDAWRDVHQAEQLGYTVNPGFINALKQATSTPSN